MNRTRTAWLLVSLLSAAASFVACGGDDAPGDPLEDGGVDGSIDSSVTWDATGDVTNDSSRADVQVDSSSDAADAADAAPVERGPIAVTFAGQPNGVLWQPGTNARLFVTDEANDRIVEWTDANGFGRAYGMPTAEDGGAGLGQVVRKLDGTMYVTRFGYGFAGTVITVRPDGDAGAAAIGDGGLDGTRRRIGLALLPDETLLDAFFTRAGSGPRVGAVARLALPRETNFLTGLSKPVGVVWNENKIYVTDQDLGVVLRIGVTGGIFVGDGGSSGDGGGTGDGGGSGDGGGTGGGDGGGTGGGDGGGRDGGADASTPARAEVFATVPSPDLLCLGPDGSLFVGSSDGNVYQVTRAGAVSTFFTGSGSTTTRGCAYDGAHHRLFVAERGAPNDAGAATNVIRILPVP